jgi:hypothetical protein
MIKHGLCAPLLFSHKYSHWPSYNILWKKSDIAATLTHGVCALCIVRMTSVWSSSLHIFQKENQLATSSAHFVFLHFARMVRCLLVTEYVWLLVHQSMAHGSASTSMLGSESVVVMHDPGSLLGR